MTGFHETYYLERNTKVANECAKRQLAGYSSESKWPDTSNFPVDAHKLDWLDAMSPHELDQEIIVARDSGNHNRYSNTNAINPLFRHFFDISTSVWTTHDQGSNTHKTFEEKDLLPPSTPRDNESNTTHNTLEDTDLVPLVSDSCIRYPHNIFMTNGIKDVRKSTSDPLSPAYTKTEKEVASEISTITKAVPSRNIEARKGKR